MNDQIQSNVAYNLLNRALRAHLQMGISSLGVPVAELDDLEHGRSFRKYSFSSFRGDSLEEAAPEVREPFIRSRRD